MSKLNDTVFIIKSGAVVERTLRDLMDYVPTTSRPDGIGTKDYARENDDGAGVYSWVTWGGPERLLQQFDDMAAAVSYVEDLWIVDIFNNTELAVYASEKDAQQALADEIADGQ